MTYISSQSLTSPMRQSTLSTQAKLAQVQAEVSSGGTPTDLGLSLGSSTGYVLSLRSDADRLGTYSATNAVADTRLSATSNALTSMLSSAQSISSSLLSSTTSTTTFSTSAKAALQALIGGLNTSAGGQSVFGGIKTDTSPVADYFSTQTSSAKQAVDSSFKQAFGTDQGSTAASSITGTQMQSYLDGQFSSLFGNSAWQSTWSSASNQTINSAVSPSQTITTSVSANQGSFQQIAQAYTMLTEFTGSNLSSDAKASVVSTATKLLNSGIAGLTNVQSGVGVAQAAITSANTQVSAQVTVLKSSASNLDSVDVVGLSAQVTSLQNQLTASYELTTRLQKLSLVNYITG